MTAKHVLENITFKAQNYLSKAARVKTSSVPSSRSKKDGFILAWPQVKKVSVVFFLNVVVIFSKKLSKAAKMRKEVVWSKAK